MTAHDLQLSSEPGESQSQAAEEYWDAVDAGEWGEEDGGFEEWLDWSAEQAADQMYHNGRNQ